MNISSLNMNKPTFGKINWGSQQQAQRTAKALISLKEANDIDGSNVLKYTDVKEQLRILAEHPDTFEVKCVISEEYTKSRFQINVAENDSKISLGTFERFYIFDKERKLGSEPNHTDIKSFAKNILHKHQTVSIKKEIEDMMNQFGKVE